MIVGGGQYYERQSEFATSMRHTQCVQLKCETAVPQVTAHGMSADFLISMWCSTLGMPLHLPCMHLVQCNVMITM